MRSLAAGRSCCRGCAAAAAAVRLCASRRNSTATVPPALVRRAAAASRATPTTAAAAARTPRGRSSSSSPPPDPSTASSTSSATRGLRRARALLEQRAPPESFSIKGVTFDNRQALIARLQAGEPVACSHEPWNKFDPQAVRISSLRGEHLGYVDRRCTGAFATREVAFGFVDSVGRVVERPEGVEASAAAATAAPGPWGARVVVWPFLAAPLPEVLPAAMAAEADARLGLRFSWEQEGTAAPTPPLEGPPARWRRLAAAALARARGVCEATGVTAAAGPTSLYGPLITLPEWRWDEARRSVVLAGAMAVCAPVARCVRSSRLPPTRRAERAAALGLAMDLMRWDVGNMREYLRWQEDRAEACERQGWGLDLGGGDEDDKDAAA